MTINFFTDRLYRSHGSHHAAALTLSLLQRNRSVPTGREQDDADTFATIASMERRERAKAGKGY